MKVEIHLLKVIPGTKPFLKRILQSDYNSNVIVKEPKKPNSLNNFLQFRKEMMESHEVYKNLPPQEGLNELDPEEVQDALLEEKASKIQENYDFKLLNADTDIQKAKNSTPTDLEQEDEVMERVEENMIGKQAPMYSPTNSTLSGEFDIVIIHNLVRQ